MSVTAHVAVAASEEAEFTFKDVPLSEPGPHEVLIRIRATGLCHTDLSVRDGNLPTHFPVVLGHEGAGVVEKVGAHVEGLEAGDHVVLSYGSCGGCRPCREGAPAYCLKLNDLNFMNERQGGDGAVFEDDELHGAFFQQSSFGTYALAHERNTVKVTQDADLALLGPLGCGIQTGAGTVMNALQPPAGSSIAVFGVGSVGLSAVMAAKLCGCAQIIAVDLNPSRLELAKELGATHTVNGDDQDAVEAIRELLPQGVDFSVECTGNDKVARQSIDALANRGTMAVVGAPPMGTEYTFDANDVLMGGKRIIGVIEGDSVVKEYIPTLIDLYLQGRFPFDRLIQRYPFEKLNEAVEDMEAGKAIKPVLEMPD